MDPEPYIVATIASLTASLPSVIESINSGATDGIVLPQPTPERIFPGGSPTDALTGFPTIEVAIPDWIVENYDLAQRGGDFYPTLIVRAFLQHADFPTLYLSSLRYARAMNRVLQQPRAMGDATIQRARGAVRVNPETEEKDVFVSGAIWVYTLDALSTLED